MLPSDETRCDARPSPAPSGARTTGAPDAGTDLTQVRAHVRTILLKLASRKLNRPQQNP
jgi:hypothetical protein